MAEKTVSYISLERVFNALQGLDSIQPSMHLEHHIWMLIERRKASMDFLIDSRSRGHIKPRTRKVLWWALAEILWMDGIPKPVVVDTAVSFSRKRHSISEASYLNGFLRSLLRELETTSLETLLRQAPEWIRFNLPQLLWERWKKQFETQQATELSRILQQKAKVILRAVEPVSDSRLLPIQAPEWAPWAHLYTPTADVTALEDLMKPGSPFYIQDMATLLAPSFCAPLPGENVADLCCAPGGKSRILAEMMKGQGHLLCSDKSSQKLPRVQENLISFPFIQFSCKDAAVDSFEQAPFDAILLDVPCSNTGVIRRKPDVRWNFSMDKLMEIRELQSHILENASRCLAPRGRLVYSTCSIESEENEEQVQEFLKNHPEFQLIKQRLILPTLEHDGAYAALLIKGE